MVLFKEGDIYRSNMTQTTIISFCIFDNQLILIKRKTTNKTCTTIHEMKYNIKKSRDQHFMRTS